MTILPAFSPSFKFGADPELFVFDKDDKPVGAYPFIPGTKADPYPVSCGAVQVDGMAAEFNINPACSYEEWEHNLKTVISELKKFIPKDYKLKAVSSVVFSQEEWDKAPDEAKELGCSPDFDAWTKTVNPPPHNEENPTLRTASGHIHIGWTEDKPPSDEEHLRHCQDLVKQLDWFLGAWSTRLDLNTARRSLYGKAGACRYKPYGVEYRVLSNFWVGRASTRLEVWNRLQSALSNMRKRFYPEEWSSYNEIIVGAINKGINSNEAQRVFADFNFPIRKGF